MGGNTLTVYDAKQRAANRDANRAEARKFFSPPAVSPVKAGSGRVAALGVAK